MSYTNRFHSANQPANQKQPVVSLRLSLFRSIAEFSPDARIPDADWRIRFFSVILSFAKRYHHCHRWKNSSCTLSIAIALHKIIHKAWLPWPFAEENNSFREFKLWSNLHMFFFMNHAVGNVAISSVLSSVSHSFHAQSGGLFYLPANFFRWVVVTILECLVN